MVILLRIDERMLHGQVAMTWVSHLQPDAILIANDEAALNEMSKLAFKLARPTGVKLAVKTLKEGAALLNNPKTREIRIFVITRTIADALKLVQQTQGIRRINIGGVKKREGGKQVSSTTYLNEEDLDHLRKLQKLTEDIEIRMVPSQPRIELDKVLK